MKYIAAAVASMLMGLPSSALAEWKHEKSGISIPDTVGEMKKGEVRDLSGGQENDVSVQYGAGPLAVTVYVYRASYPNPALWFERTLAAMQHNVGGFDGSAKPTPITLAGAPRPNGLRETFEITNPNGRAGAFKSTSFAMIQINEWMLKLRISSQDLGKDEINKKMDALIGAISFGKQVEDPLPMTTPEPCPVGMGQGNKGKPITPEKMKGSEAIAAGSLQGISALIEASGHIGLAKEPDKWCRLALAEIPAMLATTYQDRQTGNYVLLVGDSGRTLSAQNLVIPKDDAMAALFANVQGSTMLIWLFDDLPKPQEALGGGIKTIMGLNKGVLTLSTGTAQPGNAQPKKD